jgi:predicted aspartyl protease
MLIVPESWRGGTFGWSLTINLIECGETILRLNTNGTEGGHMKAKRAGDVGRFSVQFEVANHVDVIDAQRGLLEPDKVRRVNLSGVVDSGASRLVLPEAVVKQLGLPVHDKVKVRDARKWTAIRNAVREVYVQLQGRDGVFTAVVERKLKSALIVAIVLEDLDFVVDRAIQQLVPRDPRYVVNEL